MDTDTSLEPFIASVRQIVAELLGDVRADEIRDDMPLFFASRQDGLALDSLDGLKLVIALSNEYGLDPDLEIDFVEIATVRDVARYVAQRIALEHPATH